MNLYDDETCYNHALNFNFFKNFNNTDYDYNNTDSDYPEVPPIPDYLYYGNDTNNKNSTEDHWLFNPEVEFCAGHYNVTSDTYTAEASSCYGDSGGPLGKGKAYNTSQTVSIRSQTV